MYQLTEGKRLENAGLKDLVEEIKKRFAVLGVKKVDLDFHIHYDDNRLSRPEAEVIMETVLKEMELDDEYSYYASEKTGTRWITTESMCPLDLSIYLS